MATKKSSTVKPAPSATPSDAFFEIPLEMIIVESQIRFRIDQEGEEFLALVRKRPFSQYRRSVQSLRTGIEEQVEAFKKSDLEALLTDLRDLITLVEGRLPEAIDESSPKAKTLA